MSEYVRSLRAMIGNTLIVSPTVAVFPFDDARRVLLVRDKQSGLWTSAGGMVEPNETPADAAVREVWEEAGLYVELTHVIGVFGGAPGFEVTYDNGDRMAWISTLFGARPRGGTPKPDGIETVDVGWFTQDEVARIDCRPHLRMTVKAAFGWSGRALFDAASWRPPGF